MTLYDAPACPFCARVRLALAEKGLVYEAVEIDLRARPDWFLRLDARGRVPVLDDGFVLPESAAILEYLEERYPDPPLLPADPRQRALARLALVRFDVLLGEPYYRLRHGEGDATALAAALDAAPLGLSLLSDFAYLPWVVRARAHLGVSLPSRVETWLSELARRPSVAQEIELVEGLA